MHDNNQAFESFDILTEDRRDTLQEVTNVGMGSAAAKLAVLIDRFVALSIPRVVFVERSQIRVQVNSMLGSNRRFTAFRQSFRSDIAGEAMTFFDDEGTEALGKALYSDSASAAKQDTTPEWLFEIANLLTGACLTGILEQLGRRPSFSVPRVIATSLYAEDIVDLPRLDLDRALLLDINMCIEDCGFKAYLLVLMADSSVEQLGIALDTYLDSL